MLQEIFYDSLKISKFTRVCMKNVTTQVRLGGKSCFSHTNPSNFPWPLRSPLSRYTAENYRLPKFNMLFKFLLTIFFKSDLFSCLQKVDHVVN